MCTTVRQAGLKSPVEFGSGRHWVGGRQLASFALACWLMVGTAAWAQKGEPLTITREQELRFGKLTVIAPSGVVTVPATGLVDYRNALGVGGSIGPARFVLRGQPHRMVEVVVLEPSAGKFGSSGESMVDALVIEADFAREFERVPGLVRLRLDSSGMNVLTIGGRLTVTPNDSSGTTTIPIPLSARYVGDNTADQDAHDKDAQDDGR